MKSDRNTINIPNYLAAKIEIGEPNSLAICHNHSVNTDFSIAHINEFLKYKSVKVMTIVSNKGDVIYLNKTNSYNPGRLLIELSKVNEKDDQDVEKRMMAIFCRMSYTCGIERKHKK